MTMEKTVVFWRVEGQDRWAEINSEANAEAYALQLGLDPDNAAIGIARVYARVNTKPTLQPVEREI